MGSKLDLVGVIVADMAESLRFYRLLDIEIAEPAPEQDHVEATLESGLRIAWDGLEMMKGLDPDWVQPVGQRLGLAFLCDGPAGVDAKYQGILDAGFKSKREPWDAFWGQRYAQVLDPDGNVIDLFAPLA